MGPRESAPPAAASPGLARNPARLGESKTQTKGYLRGCPDYPRLPPDYVHAKMGLPIPAYLPFSCVLPDGSIVGVEETLSEHPAG